MKDHINKELSDLLSEAIILASEAHTKQYRWNGEPYILHPLRVMQAVLPQDKAHPSEKQIQLAIIAILHDTVEDNKEVTFKDFKSFPQHIQDAIKRLTKLEDEDYMEYIKEIRCDPYARKVKMADLIDNMNTLQNLDFRFNINASKRLQKYHKAFYILKHRENEGKSL